MPTLHMDVESARSVQTTLVNIHGQLTTDVEQMTNAVSGMVGSTWMGNSANEFLTTYEDWRATMNSMLENLNVLSTRLQTEINEWEQMAANLA